MLEWIFLGDIMMLVVSSVLLIINIILMFFFFFEIRKKFSVEAYEKLMQQRMQSILMDFNLQIDQAITILENRMQELRNLISDADGRFNALSHKLEAVDNLQSIMNDAVIARNNEKYAQQVTKDLTSESKVVVYSGNKDFAKKDEFTRKKIVEMAKSGWANDYIAQKVSMPLAEVELILFMENRG